MTLDNQRFLQYALYGLAVVLFYVLWQLFSSGLELFTVGLGHAPVSRMASTTLTAIPAILAAGAAAEFARRNAVANKFGVEVLSELRKVSWPSWLEVRGTTLVVLGVTLVVSFILLVFDKVYDYLIRGLFSLAS